MNAKILLLIFCLTSINAVNVILSHSSSKLSEESTKALEKAMEQKFQVKMDAMKKILEGLNREKVKEEGEINVERKTNRFRLPGGVRGRVEMTQVDVQKGDRRDVSKVSSKLAKQVLDKDIMEFVNLREKLNEDNK